MGAHFTADTVSRFLDFQTEGQDGIDRFGLIWTEIAPFVRSVASGVLRDRFVLDRTGRNDQAAVDDVIQQVAIQLLACKGGRFTVPDDGPAAIDALRAWLYVITTNAVISYCRKWHGAGTAARKVIAVSALDQKERKDLDSRLGNSAAKVEVDSRELAEVIAECLDQVVDADQKDLLKASLLKEISVRDLARKVGLNTTACQRRLMTAKMALRSELLRRGVLPPLTRTRRHPRRRPMDR